MHLIEDLGVIRGRRRGIYECQQCGVKVERDTSNYKRNPNGVCKSCSIGNSKRTHGETKSRLYNIWATMKQRCVNKNHIEYKRYGAVGITVCDEWSDFETFKEWSIANGYNDTLVIDKDILCDEKNIHPKVYSPETCMWITPEENTKYAKNKRVYQYSKDWKLIKVFPSAVDAEIETGISRQHIGSVARYHQNNTGERRLKAGGYRWTFNLID